MEKVMDTEQKNDVHEENDTINVEVKETVENAEKAKLSAWLEDISTRLNELEKSVSKVLFCLQLLAFNKPKDEEKKTTTTPISCPARTKPIRINLSDIEDLDDNDNEQQSNVMMDVSSEDPDMPKRRRSTRGRKKEGASTNGTSKKKSITAKDKKANDDKKLASQKRKSVTDPLSDDNNERGGTVRKNLFHASSKQGESSGINVENHSRPLMNNDNISDGVGIIYFGTGKILPKSLPTRFSPTSDMELTMDEIQVCAYVFAMEVDLSEVVFKMRNSRATIKDFDCLCPGKPIEDEIIKLMAMRNTWRQMNINVQTVWTLPPAFASDIIQGQPKENIGMSYVTEWMPPFEHVKYIYVPIKENNEHWYLMVVSMEQEIVYHLDSNPQVARLKERRDNITRVCQMLVYLMTSDWLPIHFMNKPNDLDTWEIKGITPNQGPKNSINSAIWLLEWMAMDYAFQPNVHSVINEKKVRMKTTLSLFLVSHNEVRKNLEAKLELHYHTNVQSVEA
ncbi:Ulp1 protease family, C-terminal catalytic domain [Sesbania bispinosa]|nr:Ulp1 protease family, C-terminal catalytic domain [Sesbania bispinosa]